jgi:peptidoglycan/xylan/chitin deacetylase (PgdA/CDA1 family)
MTEGPLIGGALGILTAGGFLAHAVRGRSSTVFGPSIYHGDRTRSSLALTFDDGPSESTPMLLDVLARQQVKATFFMCGKNVERLPGIARQVAAAGHEIGNHSDAHPRFDFRSSRFMYQELARAQETIARATGITPKLFRAPYGVRWFGLRSAQQHLNLLGVMWSILGHDWRWPGDIVCLHDGRLTEPRPDITTTISAVEAAIPVLRERGFHLGTVSEIL